MYVWLCVKRKGGGGGVVVLKCVQPYSRPTTTKGAKEPGRRETTKKMARQPKEGMATVHRKTGDESGKFRF